MLNLDTLFLKIRTRHEYIHKIIQGVEIGKCQDEQQKFDEYESEIGTVAPEWRIRVKAMDLDFKQLWNERKAEFRRAIFTEEEKSQYEENLQYKLPQSYISLLQNTQNGGLLKRNCFPIYDENQNVKQLFLCSYISSICDLKSEKARKAYPGLVNLPDIGIYFGKI
ncbi:SMI1/KNR4 family protein [Paenibacillaceae bacterium]|nr:SMI1/KNR4 family protein [Paenibacillaceae bacterium]